MFKINPYRPGAGLKPMYIAGRDEDIESVEQIFEALTMNVPVQSIIYSGLRGVGKTVLINKFMEIIYVFLTIFLYLLKCPQSLILSALRAFCFCGKPHISRSIFLYFRYQAWLKSW